MFKKLAILGASRGLGAAVARYAATHLPELQSILISSRKVELLDKLKTEIAKGGDGDLQRPFTGSVATYLCDFAQLDQVEKMHTLINDCDLVVYCAGGGPHGEFQNKEWKDHQWALMVNLLTPMALAHKWLKGRTQKGCLVIVGSRIAEQSPDPLAASYAAGKHGLYGFVSSLQDELKNGLVAVKLFSPGYMDSTLLPMTAKVRHDGSKLMSVDTAAQGMLRWIKKGGPWHRVLN